MRFQPLDGEQSRQLINMEQLWEAYQQSRQLLQQRFPGSMSWKRIHGREYLYRKAGKQNRSLGPRSADTERIWNAFHEGRERERERASRLQKEIARAAKVCRALDLGRVPPVAARLVRRLDDLNLLDHRLMVIGTPALFAYERLAGVQLHSESVATGDFDLLLDVRAGLGLLPEGKGLNQILKEADPTFRPLRKLGFRAVNDVGYMVDLVTPMPANPASAQAAAIGFVADDDLQAAEIEGLQWLQNAPSIQQVVLDEQGYPLTLRVPDPRAFALHKLWVSEQPSRDPLKKRRDRTQAVLVARLIANHLPHLEWNAPELGALPADLRARATELADEPDEDESWF